jgi:hypothetical protein
MALTIQLPLKSRNVYSYACGPWCFVMQLHAAKGAAIAVTIPSNPRSSKSRASRTKSRPAKIGRKWTQDDLLAYNIKVVYQDLETFFGVKDLPPPNVHNDAITARDVAAAKDF